MEKLAAMDANAKDKELLFLKDKVLQLQTQASTLQKRIKKKGKRPHYTLNKRLFILWHIETFQIPRRRVSEYYGIARSTLYRWIHKIEDQTRSPTTPANKTSSEIAALVLEITKAHIDWGRFQSLFFCFIRYISVPVAVEVTGQQGIGKAVKGKFRIKDGRVQVLVAV